MIWDTPLSPEAAPLCSSSPVFVYPFCILALLLQMLGSGSPDKITTLQVQSEPKRRKNHLLWPECYATINEAQTFGKAIYIVVFSHLAHGKERKLSFHSHLLWFPTASYCSPHPQTLPHWASVHPIPLHPLPSALFTTLSVPC